MRKTKKVISETNKKICQHLWFPYATKVSTFYKVDGFPVFIDVICQKCLVTKQVEV